MLTISQCFYLNYAGNSSFPLCIGVGILHQLRSRLLQSDFNECILLFSDLPEINIDVVVEKAVQIFCQTPKSATYRFNAGNTNQVPGEFALPYVGIEDLKNQPCCHISAEDLIQLFDLYGKNQHSNEKIAKSKSRISVIDIRHKEDFNRGSIPGSINYPYGTMQQHESVGKLIDPKQKLVVIIGNSGSPEVDEFATICLHLSMKGVCILRGGIEVLKPIGVLTIST